MTRSKKNRVLHSSKKNMVLHGSFKKPPEQVGQLNFRCPYHICIFGVVSTTACPLNGLNLSVQHPLLLHPNIPSIWACIRRQHHPALRCQAGRTVHEGEIYIYIFTYIRINDSNQHSIIPGSYKKPGSEIDI